MIATDQKSRLSPKQVFRKLALDESFFLRALCSVADLQTQNDVPLVLNPAQARYIAEIRKPGVRKDVVGKSRKWGFSTIRLGVGLHSCCYMRNRIFRIVAHKEATNKETLRPILWKLYESAVDRFKAHKLNPYDFLPRVTNGNGFGTDTSIEFGDIGSAIVFSTAAGAGVGQAERSDDLYLTEYADWEHAHHTFTKLSGSQPKGNPFTRLTIDFNANGTTNDAYAKYTDAQKSHDDPDWNGFTPFFAGIDDVPAYYPAKEMEIELRALGSERFKEVYPRNDTEMWVQSARAVFASSLLDEAVGRSVGYWFEPGEPTVHGIDTATGMETGDKQAMVTLCYDRYDGVWREAVEPFGAGVREHDQNHGHWPEDVFAGMCRERVHRMPGLTVPERNVGSALIIGLRETVEDPRGRVIDISHLIYRHRQRDKDGKQKMVFGFPTTSSSKKVMIADLNRMLREGSIALTSPRLLQQLRDYEWKTMETTGGRYEQKAAIAGAPDRKGAHDDLVMALLMAIQGIMQPGRGEEWEIEEAA